MNDFDRMRGIKEAAQRRLLAIPGIHAVGIGKKFVKGAYTDEWCIAVFVRKKKPLENLSPEEVVPPEIDGVKTDVIEERPPNLLSGGRTGDPSELAISISADKHVITFAGKETPGIGLLAVIDFAVAPSGGAPRAFNVFCQTTGPALEDSDTMTLAQIVDKFAHDIRVWASFVSPSALSTSVSGNQVLVTPGNGYIVEVTGAKVFAYDDHKYRQDPALSGGIKIQAGGPAAWGTLGFIAHTNEPQSKIVALTCQHVVAAWGGERTSLGVTVSADQHTITFDGSATPNSAIVLTLDVMPVGPGPSQPFKFFLAPTSETLPQIATKVSDWINSLYPPGVGVHASHSGSHVTINWEKGFIALARCTVYQPQVLDRHSELRAAITNTNVITLTGQASGENYGVYINCNVGGTTRSFGTFVNVTEAQPLGDIAGSLASSINALSIGGVHASATGAVITITGVQEVECIISSDIRVGQPDNSFGSKCCPCGDHRIGRVIKARLDIDTALILLDAGQKYLAEIAELGVVSGTHHVVDGDLPYVVLKRGMSTGPTAGWIRYLHVDGILPQRITLESGNVNDVLNRYYTDAMLIDWDDPDPFAYGGDSGSAIINSSGKIVGILFGGGDRTFYATPIQQIEAAFDISVTIATTKNDVRTVPKTTEAFASGGGVGSPVSTASLLDQRLRDAELALTAIPLGEQYVRLFERHFAEAARLVNDNRRVATVWHRNGGPQLLQDILQTVQSDDCALPTQVDGKPLSDCLTRIQDIFVRYGSRQLAADLQHYGPPLTQLKGLTYPQVLEALRGMQLE